jgi:hypothetical protein
MALAPAHFSNTIVYAGEVSAFGIHVVGYQNSAQSRPAAMIGPYDRDPYWEPGRQSQQVATGNAMLLHFPAAEPMTPYNMLDTTPCPHILEDLEEAVTPHPMAPPEMTLGAAPGLAAMPDVVVFTRGIYDVVLARSAGFVAEALHRVHPDKRPPLNEAIFRLYQTWFPDWPVALCCFNNTELVRSLPLLWWYRPRNPGILFAPALDGHDGAPPRLDGPVAVDHTVVFGSDRLVFGNPVHYSDKIDAETVARLFAPNQGSERAAARQRAREAQEKLQRALPLWHYLPERVDGRRYHEMLPNGDFTCQVWTLLEGNTHIMRSQPDELRALVG